SDDRLLVSMICDGFHLLPEEVRVFYKVKGPDRTILASDITGYSSMSPGKYVTSEGDTIELTGEGRLKYPARDVLYGSTSLLKDDVTNVMKLTGCSLADAIKMASTNPARLYGLNDRGTIEVGKRADLIMFRMVDSQIVISRTYVKGNLVYNASAGSK
ncbi:MAG: amidohydrolase family protein, partial [Bacteroidales bacterium]|nr:amidohydrolase family protein [Bacteroidales bacterium]